ncbi:hypothetical protein CKALI_00900 [Corynebacterium kalinowskii]|uniref:Uncharacterized protein n=1 Tax=Corynebacterium kalinowskii TaxID=2675216 RepID=A0A6B8VMV3_9CORY|nr:hypothetical protein CKALI_00900 [Corynebacterium kalinowskii]
MSGWNVLQHWAPQPTNEKGFIMDLGLLFDGIVNSVKALFNVATGSAEGIFATVEYLFDNTSSALGSN